MAVNGTVESHWGLCPIKQIASRKVLKIRKYACWEVEVNNDNKLY